MILRNVVSTRHWNGRQETASPQAVGDSACRVEYAGRRRGHCRVMVLWSHVPPYLAACLEALLGLYDAELLLVVTRADTPGNHTALQRFANFRYVNLAAADGPSEAAVGRMVGDFKPAVVVAGCGKWGPLTRLAKVAKEQGSLVVWAEDHYWRGSWRDHANAGLSALGLIYNFFDAVWVPGSLGRLYAQRLGFDDGRIFEGVYACDTGLFRRVGLERFGSGGSRGWPQVFLLVGQYIKRKNLDTLLQAYALYRDAVAHPWELWCAGRGPLQGKLQNRRGVRDYGYQNPAGCAELMAQAGAFVLPSWVDHWGVVIHEATCAGLPILATRTCAATANLVREGYNGFSFSAHEVERLAGFMGYVSEANRAEIMGRNSLQMSYQFDPKLWAETLVEHIPHCLRGRTLVFRTASSPA